MRARHCIDIAGDLDGARKLVLLEMAKAWMRLAGQAERNQKTDVVYEPPQAKTDSPPPQQAAPTSEPASLADGLVPAESRRA